MSEDWLTNAPRAVAKMAEVDASAPNVARVWNFLIGGKDNFEADRQAAAQLVAAAPVMAAVAPASRAFLQRAVRFLTEQAKIRQFLDIGTGIPSAGHTHEVAQQIAPESRVVYVDNDPVVLAHARALLTSTPAGVTNYLDVDARDPAKVLADAAETLDFGEPVAVILVDVLNFIEGTAQVRSILSTLRDGLCPGSYLAIMQPASDLDPALNIAARRWNQLAPTRVVLRTRDEVGSFTDGLDLVDPGLVTVPQWRPAPSDPGYPEVMPLYALVGRTR